MPNFYYATAGSFIEPGLLTESKNRKLFIIDGTCPLYTTAGSFIETHKSSPSKRRFVCGELFGFFMD
jgi:hypothetical protein